MNKTNETVVAWGIDLGTTNSTLCRTRLPAGAASPTEPEVVPLRQPTPAGEFTGTLLPSIGAIYQGREFVGQGAKDIRALMADTSKGIVRNVNLFHDCKNEIGTSRTYSSAPEGYRTPTDIAARILGYLHREGIGEATFALKVDEYKQVKALARENLREYYGGRAWCNTLYRTMLD